MLLGDRPNAFHLPARQVAIVHQEVGQGAVILLFGKFGLHREAVFDFLLGGQALLNDEPAEHGVLFFIRREGHD